jgi:hypothetical protein
VAGFVCAVYAICGGVVWSAYKEFGNQSLLDLAHVVLADRTPLKLLPRANPRARAALPDRVGSDQLSARAAAPAAHPAVPIRQAAAPLAPPLGGGHGSKADTLDLIERPAMARHDPEPAATALKAQAAAVGALQAEKSVTAALEMQSLGPRGAAPGSATPAASDQVPQPQPAATLPPTPAFKPLDAVPTVVAQAVPLPRVGHNIGRSRLDDSPPVPSLKPIFVASEQPPGRTSGQGTPRVTATKPTLPDALRAFWTNLKILLASGPAPRVIPAAGGNAERGDGFANAGGHGDGGTSVASRGSNDGASSASGSGANSGGGNGKGNSRGGGGSANDGGGSANGGGVSVGASVSVGGGASVGGGGSSGGDAGNGSRNGNGRGGENGRGGRGNDGDDGRRDGGRGDGDRGRGDDDDGGRSGRGDGDGGRGGRDGGRGDGDDDGDDD